MHREEYPCREYTRRNMHIPTALPMPRELQNEQLQRRRYQNPAPLPGRSACSKGPPLRHLNPKVAGSNNQQIKPIIPIHVVRAPLVKAVPAPDQSPVDKNEFSCADASYTERIRGSVRAIEGCRDLRFSYDLMDEGGTPTTPSEPDALKGLLSLLLFHL